MCDNTVRELLCDMFNAAIAAVQPALTLPRYLPKRPKGRTTVTGAGKASAAMAHVFEQAWDTSANGLVVTCYGYAIPYKQIRIVEAAHPVPGAIGPLVVHEILDLVSGLTEDDLMVCLTSGGDSSLLSLLLPGIPLADEQAVNRALLAFGATITEMSCVRRHLSAIRDRRLAVACYPICVCNLLLSDMPGDDPVNIASGPTVPDATTLTGTLGIIRRYDIAILPPVRNVFTSRDSETIKPGDIRLPRIKTRLVATPHMALQATARVACEAGFAAYAPGDAIEGEVRDVNKVLGGIAPGVTRRAEPFPVPCVLLSGGETTVTVRGKGKDGRNVRLLLSFALILRGQLEVHTIVGDTDGADGLEGIADAIVTPNILQCAWQLGLHAQGALTCNDEHGFFEALGDAVVTGPTMASANNFRAILIAPDLEQLPWDACATQRLSSPWTR